MPNEETLYEDRPTDRVMVFVDLANLVGLVAQTETAALQLDFIRMVRLMVGNRRLVGAYIFDGSAIRTDASQSPRFKIHEKLRLSGFRMVIRDVRVSIEGRQKEVDVALATEMVVGALRDSYDVAILVSGDRDFVPAVERAQSEGKIVEVASFWRAEHQSPLSQALRRSSDRVHCLEQIPILELVGANQETST